MCLFIGLLTVLALASTANAGLDSVDQARILGTPDITCSTKWVTLSFKTSVPFQGRVFVEDMAFDSRCSAQYTSNLAFNATFRFPMRPCTRIDNSGNNGNAFVSWANIRINFHPIFILQNSRVLRVSCADSGANGPLEPDANANSLCKHVVTRTHVANYAVVLRRCDVVSKAREVVHVVDPNGCVVDELLMASLTYATNRLEMTAHTKMFRFIDSQQLRFTCNIALVPRTARHAHVTKTDSNINTIYFERGDQLYRDFSAINNGSAIIETQTTTEWFFVRDNPTTAQRDRAWVVSGRIDRNINNDQVSHDKLEHQDVLKHFMPNQHPYGRSNLTRLAKLPDTQTQEPFPDPEFGNFDLEESVEQLVVFTKPTTTTASSRITTTTTARPSTLAVPKKVVDESSALNVFEKSLIKDAEVPKDHKKVVTETKRFEFPNINSIEIEVLRNEDNAVSQAVVGTIDHKADWRLDDVILNKTEDLIYNCASELANLNKTQTMFIHPGSLSCTWRSVNVALLLWSLGSVLIWLVLLATKLYRRFTVKTVPQIRPQPPMPRPHIVPTWYRPSATDYAHQNVTRIGSNFHVSTDQR
uniref:ZP domain-containing protein n=1 Tax=Panagrellus redivivus TaxID=6233 RepID=A0A7E4V5T6_PANRE